MPSPLRPVSIHDNTGTQIRARHLIGVDESGNEASTDGICVSVAVRTQRSGDLDLVRSLIQSDLKPFKHKSSSLVRYEDVSLDERTNRVEDLIDSLEQTSVTWAAVACVEEVTIESQAAATSMAAKKAVTSAIGQNIFSGKSDPAALLHDGTQDQYSDYEKHLRKQISADFDNSFQYEICPVHLTFIQDADRTYPQSNAADYIAGYIRDKLDNGHTIGDLPFENIHRLDPSWIRTAGESVPFYQLAEFDPIQEDRLRSRILSWLIGKGIPQDPEPTTQDPYRDIVTQITDERVREYLLEEVETE